MKNYITVKMDEQNLMLLETAARRLKEAAERDALQQTGGQKELAQLTARAWGDMLTKAIGGKARLKKLLNAEATALPPAPVMQPPAPTHH